MHRNRDFTSDGRDAQKQRDFTSDGRDAQKQRDFTSGRSTFFGSKLQDGLTNDMECQLQRTQLCLWQDAKTDTVFRMVNLPKQTARTSGGVKELSSVSSFFTTSPLSFQSISITFISLAHSAASKPPCQYHLITHISITFISSSFAKCLGSLLLNIWVH